MDRVISYCGGCGQEEDFCTCTDPLQEELASIRKDANKCNLMVRQVTKEDFVVESAGKKLFVGTLSEVDAFISGCLYGRRKWYPDTDGCMWSPSEF